MEGNREEIKEKGREMKQMKQEGAKENKGK